MITLLLSKSGFNVSEIFAYILVGLEVLLVLSSIIKNFLNPESKIAKFLQKVIDGVRKNKDYLKDYEKDNKKDEKDKKH